MDKIMNIKTELLVMHPDNPRKDLGNLDELTDSIKGMGVLNPLLVVHMMDGTYRIIAGHRRAAAAKRAGVEEVPCIVTKMTALEQQYAMWTENEQRQQLTPREQAGGIQMMLDLGATMEDVAEKTGLSKKTVKARAEIARLDQKVLEKIEKDKSTYQLSIQDYEELGRIKDIKRRNEILERGVYGHNDLVNKVEAELRKQLTRKNLEILKPILKKQGILKSDDKSITWSPKWEILQRIDLTQKSLKINEVPDKERQVFWIESFATLYIAVLRQEEEDRKREIAKEELERKKAKVYMDSLATAYRKELGDFVKSIVDKKVFCLEAQDSALKKLWKMFTEERGWEEAVRGRLEGFVGEWLHPEILEEKKLEELTENLIEETPVVTQLVICIFSELPDASHNWEAGYYAPAGNAHIRFRNILNELYGYIPTRIEFDQMIDGTHKKYRGDR